MSDDTKILMSVPKDIIDAQVRAAVAQALAKDPTELVRAVVNAAIAEQEPRHYGDKRTLFQKKLNELIREVAIEEFKKFLETQRPAIAVQIKQALGKDTRTFVAKIAERLAMSLTGFNVSVDWQER